MPGSATDRYNVDQKPVTMKRNAELDYRPLEMRGDASHNLSESVVLLSIFVSNAIAECGHFSLLRRWTLRLKHLE